MQLTDPRYATVVDVTSSRPPKPRVLVHAAEVPRDEALILDLKTIVGLGIRRSIKPAQLSVASLKYLGPPTRVSYFFEPVATAHPDPPVADGGCLTAWRGAADPRGTITVPVHASSAAFESKLLLGAIRMIYKFKSKAAGDVIMMGPAGDAVLRLIGKEPAAQGIIEVSAMASSIAAIEQAIQTDEAAAKGQTAAPRGGVTLRQRAWPLVEMMKRSCAEDADIVWGA